MTPRVVGVDLSLTSTGLADNRGRTERVQTKPLDKGPRPVAETLGRINHIAVAAAGFVHDWPKDDYIDLVVIEGPSYGSPGQQHTSGGLWWLTADTLNCPILVVTPSQRMMYATGKGQIGKDQVLAAAIRRYPDFDITGNDIADAVILCAIGCRMLGHPLEESLPQTHLRALAKLTLPDGVTA